LFLLSYAGALAAQSTLPASTYVVPADSVLARWERDARSGVVNNLGTVWIIHNIRNPVPRPRLDSLLNGLDRFATSSDSEQSRHAAVGLLLLAGEADMPRPIPGIVARMARIYHDAAAPRIVRFTIRRRLPFQAEQRAAAALLRSIAAEADPNPGAPRHDMGDPRIEALGALRQMGAEGRAALQAMHRSGEARSPHAREALREMAAAGFPVREPERTP
jgi:hypothetical protein